jgi:hypothetical protein
MIEERAHDCEEDYGEDDSDGGYFSIPHPSETQLAAVQAVMQMLSCNAPNISELCLDSYLLPSVMAFKALTHLTVDVCDGKHLSVCEGSPVWRPFTFMLNAHGVSPAAPKASA